METEHIMVFWRSPNGRDHWEAVKRDEIPQWLRDEEYIERLLAGEQVVNTEDPKPYYYKVVEIDRPRPAGQNEARVRAMRAAMDVGIIIP